MLRPEGSETEVTPGFYSTADAEGAAARVDEAGTVFWMKGQRLRWTETRV